jgi:hypothetical protein
VIGLVVLSLLGAVYSLTLPRGRGEPSPAEMARIRAQVWD